MRKLRPSATYEGLVNQLAPLECLCLKRYRSLNDREYLLVPLPDQPTYNKKVYVDIDTAEQAGFYACLSEDLHRVDDRVGVGNV